MSRYGIILTGQGATSGFSQDIADLKEQVQDLEPLLNLIADRVVLPALSRNYDTSGLKTHSGVLKNAICTRHAPGNVIEINGRSLTVGISYSDVPGSKEAIEGRGSVYARQGHFLRFFDENGKPIFVKHVGPAPAHDVYYLTDGDVAEAQALAAAWFAGHVI